MSRGREAICSGVCDLRYFGDKIPRIAIHTTNPRNNKLKWIANV